MEVGQSHDLIGGGVMYRLTYVRHTCKMQSLHLHSTGLQEDNWVQLHAINLITRGYPTHTLYLHELVNRFGGQ